MQRSIGGDAMQGIDQSRNIVEFHQYTAVTHHFAKHGYVAGDNRNAPLLRFDDRSPKPSQREGCTSAAAFRSRASVPASSRPPKDLQKGCAVIRKRRREIACKIAPDMQCAHGTPLPRQHP